MVRIPPLETERLVIREFTRADLEAAHQLLDRDLADDDMATDGATSRDARRQWLTWAAASYEQLDHLRQPPYTDRAIVLRATGELAGACGLVPCLCPFQQLPGWDSWTGAPVTAATPDVADSSLPLASQHTVAEPARFTAEVGLFWAIAPSLRRLGHATEAASALVSYAFQTLQLARVVATTRHDNAASAGVMRKLGMRILRNSLLNPPWFQVVGVLRSDEWDQKVAGQ